MRDQIVRGELQEVVFVATFLSTILNFDRRYADGKNLSFKNLVRTNQNLVRTSSWSGPGLSVFRPVALKINFFTNS